MNKEHSQSGRLSRCVEGHIYSNRKHGRLCPFCYSVLEGDANLSIPKNEKLIPPKPPIGWLVCLTGASQGQDYRIVEEKNFIGSATDMHIRILGDDQIKERNHGFISYDPLNQKMTLVPESGMMLLNHQRILQPTKLNDDDVITIGRSQFLLLFLYKDHTAWEEWSGEGQFVQNSPVVDDFMTSLEPDKPTTQDKKESDLSLTMDKPKSDDDPYPDEGGYADVAEGEKMPAFPLTDNE